MEVLGQGEAGAQPPPFPRLNPDAEEIREAEEAYDQFHWGETGRRRISPRRLPRAPKVLVELGSLEAVTYGTTKAGDGYSHYEHAFGETGGAKPRLAMDPKTKRLWIVGGRYTVTERGIEG